MDGKRFDSLARTIGRRRSRRGAIQALAAAALGAAAAKIGLSTEPAEAAQVMTERRFNCSAIGQKCNGKDSNCCSGRCSGKGAKKGKKKNGKRRKDRKDKSTCVAHDENGCTSGQDTCASGVRVPCGRGSNGGCLQTTGNAGFCGQIQGGPIPPRLGCAVCEKDLDCEDLGYGRGAACVVCESSCEFENNNATACVGAWD